MDEEVFTYLRSGIYYRPLGKIEFAALTGMGIQVNTSSGISEFMAGACIGYKLGRARSK